MEDRVPPVTREASRHATRYNKRLTLPSAPAPCHNSRVMGRPPAPQRILSSDRPEESTGPFRHRPTRRAPARCRPGPAPIGVGGRRRVGRPRSRFSRRRRRRRHGLHDGMAMNASRSCCLLRRATAPRRWLWLPRPRQAGQRRPDIARSVQKVEARTGPPLLARTCSGPRGAHRSPPRRLQCAPLRRSTHGFTERCFY